jgi:hypothetical protein
VNTAFLDAQHVSSFLGDDGLARMVRSAQSYNPKLVSVARVSDLRSGNFGRFLRATFPRLGIVVPYEELDTVDLLNALADLQCEPKDCVLFIDFVGAPLDVDGASSSVAALFDLAAEAAQWGRIVFQASSFPSKNPASPGGTAAVARSEWKVFNEAIAECSVLPHLIGYGDYGADSGVIRFSKKGGGRAIRHIRYTSADEVIVFRSAETGKDTDLMQGVCHCIVSSPHYCGRGFSYADERIWRIAKGLDGPGNASNWREWNMAHHMTKVVRDLGSASGVEFVHRIDEDFESTPDLFSLPLGA